MPEHRLPSLPERTAGTIILTPGTFAAVATTPNQIATANAVQALGSGPVFNAVIGQSVAGAQQAFTRSRARCMRAR